MTIVEYVVLVMASTALGIVIGVIVFLAALALFKILERFHE